MKKLRAVQPTSAADAARYRPVQSVNGRVIRKCCQNTGSRSIIFFQIVHRETHITDPLIFLRLPN